MKAIFSCAVAAFLLTMPAVSHGKDQSCPDGAAIIATTPAPPSIPRKYKELQKLLGSIPPKADIVLVGDSLFANWRKSIRESFPEKAVFNFALGGDRTQEMLWRLDQVNLQVLKPEAVAILAGTNNLRDPGTVACGVFAGIKAIVGKARSTWPDAPIFVLTVPPRGKDFAAYDEQRNDLNAMIKRLSVDAPNVYPVVIDDNEITEGNYGKPKLSSKVLLDHPDRIYRSKWYRDDNLHFKDPAYRLIARYLSKASQQSLGKDVFTD